MIRAYPSRPSVFPGETLLLHVSTTSPFFRVEFFRQGPTLVRMKLPVELVQPGIYLPDGPSDLDWGWPGYEFALPTDWPSGAYVAMLIEIQEDGSEITPDRSSSFATEAKALFIVRHRGLAEMGTPLYKVSWATFVAYNATGYGSLYTEALWSDRRPDPGFKVSWRRPGCGTGGIVMAGDPEDYYDTSSRRQTFEHWDAPFIRWLEATGYRPHYCTDWDLQTDPHVLEGYSLLLSVGHDEYWSEEMRSTIEKHIARGGNVAFFSGNIAGYRIHFTDDSTAFTCAKIPPSASAEEPWERDSWFEVNPECRVTGVSIALAGGWWTGKRQTLGYTVQHAGHWLFSGSGLAEGEVFGNDEDFPLLGYEVDGATFRRRHGRWVVTGEKGTPRNFVILGLAELGEGWVTTRPGAAATMGIYVSPRGGIVFQGATTDWPILVGRNHAVAQITRNVLDRLRLPSVHILGPLPLRGGRMLAGAGERVSFHADCGHFTGFEGHEFRFDVAGACILSRKGPLVEVEMPAEPDFVTVSVSVLRHGETIGFGTTTLLPLSREEVAGLEVLNSIRELVLPEDPKNALAAADRDPADLLGLLYANRLPWLEDRAHRVAEGVRKLARAKTEPDQDQTAKRKG